MRIPDQPPPKQGNEHPPVADMVKEDVLMQEYGKPYSSDAYDKDVLDTIADIEERKQVGIARYGTPLRGFDGRDNWIDLYQEVLDSLNYFRKGIYEVLHPSDNTQPKPDLTRMMEHYRTVIKIAVEIRRYMNRRGVDTDPKLG